MYTELNKMTIILL